MAEQTIEVVREPNLPRTAAARAAHVPTPDTAEALRQARACLETADRRLRRGDARHTDEILRLLQSATDLLESALFTEPCRTG